MAGTLRWPLCSALLGLCALMAAGGGRAQAVELYAKTGLAHNEQAQISGLHDATKLRHDGLAVFDIGLRGKPLSSLRLKYDYQSKRHGSLGHNDWDTHKLKGYLSLPDTAASVYLNLSHYAWGHEAYLLTQEIKPRVDLAWRGGTLQPALAFRDKDYHVYDGFDSTAWGTELAYRKAGRYTKLSAYQQDTSNDDYDFREVKAYTTGPLGRIGRYQFKYRAELGHKDYTHVSDSTLTQYRWTAKLRGEVNRSLHAQLGAGWRLRARLQLSQYETNLSANSYQALYGGVMLIYQGSGKRQTDNDENN